MHYLRYLCVRHSACVCVWGIIHPHAADGSLFKMELQRTICTDLHALEL